MKHNLTKSATAAEAIHPETGLTALQERCALLLASGIRITDAAKQVGASRCTLYRWLNQTAFACYCNLMKDEVKKYVEGSLLGLHDKALEGIKACLDSPKEEVRLRASLWVVDRISQMQIGETDVRKALRSESEVEYQFTFGEAIYQRALEEGGLKE